MRRALALTLTLAVLGLALPIRAADPPEPSPYPTTWELTFEHKQPRRIVVNVPGARGPKAYWYLPYTVTNEGEESQNFIPEFEMLTDDGKIHRATRSTPKQVFAAIRGRERNRLLLPPTRVSGELRVGVDQARDSVVIWQEPQRDMGEFRIFVGGLSGEFIEMKDEEGKLLTDSKGEPIILRKTLQLTYHTKGDDVYAGEDQVYEGEGRIGRNAKKWVMR